MKTPTPSSDDPAQEDLLQKYQERVKGPTKKKKPVIKICTVAGFLTTVDVGQYFITKDTEEFSQFTESVAFREYTLAREEKLSDPKGWIRGNTKIGPDGCICFCKPTKAKAKPRRPTAVCSSTRTAPIGERKWTDIEPLDYSHIDYPVSKQLSTLLRHGDLPREEDGAIEFLRLQDYLRNEFGQSQHWSDEKWKSTMATGRGNKKRFQYCTDPSGQEILLSPSSSRSFRTQSH